MRRTLFKKKLLHSIVASLVVAGVAVGLLYPKAAAAQSDTGHILIADQFNNRVIEVDRATHQIVWHFGNGSDLPGPHSVVGTNDAERFGSLTLISGTGTPPGLPGCGDQMNGCPDNRVFIVDHDGNIIWQYGQAGVGGSGPNQLNTPVQALFLINFPGHPGPHVLITDQVNERIILVNLHHQIVWQYGTTGMSGMGSNQLNNPNSAEALENGHILIADENNNRVIEIRPNGQLVKQFTAGGTVSGAAFASRLPNGDTLITDSNNNRAIEVNGNDHIVWKYVTNTQPNSNPAPLPTRAIRLHNGDTLISDQFNDRVIEVTPAGKIVFHQGDTNIAGDGFNDLNGPYDAKQIGDFTGLTPPFDFDQE
ncbi:NHL repeat-containing protein [Dyella flagellata]|uniref:Uncharacterized protein n=1 Tax=Dyella flagellata TaxID=1867833 RepID=A0ABQ5X9J3_9GAMM|nr:hypothetical protein [Dyella flagellata]GLQ88345.1 hypothetical protein GCM10007898_19140 [Dyella flagellata]